MGCCIFIYENKNLKARLRGWITPNPLRASGKVYYPQPSPQGRIIAILRHCHLKIRKHNLQVLTIDIEMGWIFKYINKNLQARLIWEGELPPNPLRASGKVYYPITFTSGGKITILRHCHLSLNSKTQFTGTYNRDWDGVNIQIFKGSEEVFTIRRHCNLFSYTETPLNYLNTKLIVGIFTSPPKVLGEGTYYFTHYQQMT